MKRSLRLVAVLCTVLWCGGGVACHKQTVETGGISGVLGGSRTPAISASDNPRDVLVKAMRTSFDAKSYRALMTTSLSDGTNSVATVEYVAPDRFRMVRGQNETIIVGKTTYIKGANGQWQKSPVDMGQMISNFRDPKVIDELTKNTDVKLVGPDVLDGAPMLVYQYTLMLGNDIKSTAKTWLGTTDGLPRKTESDADMNFMGKQTKSHTTVLYSEFNGDIKIEPPLQ